MAASQHPIPFKTVSLFVTTGFATILPDRFLSASGWFILQVVLFVEADTIWVFNVSSRFISLTVGLYSYFCLLRLICWFYVSSVSLNNICVIWFYITRTIRMFFIDDIFTFLQFIPLYSIFLIYLQRLSPFIFGLFPCTVLKSIIEFLFISMYVGDSRLVVGNNFLNPSSVERGGAR